MNEYDEYLNENYTNGLCRFCFQTNFVVRFATNEEISLLQTFLQPQCLDYNIKLCVYCGSLLKKLLRFCRQCQKASDALIQGLEQKPNCIAENFHNLSISKPITYQLDPCNDDIQPVFKSEGFEALVDSPFHDLGADDDDVPLSMLSKDVDLESLTESGTNNEVEIKYENRRPVTFSEMKPEDEKTTKSSKKKIKEKYRMSKKKLKNGFSSRMVQETDEYVVIKLSKEEVLQEMKKKSQSESYIRAQYKCSLCVKGFNFADVLRNHNVRHSPDHGPLQCDICQQYCPNAVSLRGHLKSHTSRYKCKMCGEVRLARQHLLEHFATTHMPESVAYTCEHCEFVTNDGQRHLWCEDFGTALTNPPDQRVKRTVMQRHIKTHEPSLDYSCEICGQRFKAIETLRVHTKRHDERNFLSCSQCNKKFIYQSLLQRHINLVHVKRDLYCVECDKRFNSPENLKVHFKRAKRHRDASSYTHSCPECPARFVQQASVAAHLATEHGHAKRFECHVCRRVYCSRDSLRCHVRRVHSNNIEVKKHACDACDKVFGQKSTLRRHRRVHTGERPHACSECSLRFAQSSTLYTHRALVHRKLPRSKKLQQQQQAAAVDALPDVPNDSQQQCMMKIEG